MKKRMVKCGTEEKVLEMQHYEENMRAPFFWIDFYPYNHKGEYINRKTVKGLAYKVAYLENDYIRAEFIPEVGGRIFSAFDKVNKKHMFFRNFSSRSTGSHIGVYQAMGVEINYPDAHSLTTSAPREFSLCKNPDGSASVTISEFERVFCSRWQYTFILKPDESVLHMKVKLFNRTSVSLPCKYWLNAAVPISPNFEYIYPETEADQHGGESYFSWPIYDGKNISMWKNVEEILGLYMLNVKEGFFGYYNHDAKNGAVHWADYRVLPGKKYWGNGNTGFNRNRSYLWGDGSEYGYGEIQAGRIENQDYFEWIQPYTVEEWEECWYPIFGTEGFVKASEKAALNVKKSTKKWEIFIQTTSSISDLKIHILIGSKKVEGFKVRTDIGRSIKVLTSRLWPQPFTIDLIDKNEVILRHEVKEKKIFDAMRNSRDIKKFIDETRSAEYYYSKGAWEYQNKYNDHDAVKHFEKALEIDPYHTGSLLMLGEYYFKKNKLFLAKEKFQKALLRDPLKRVPKARYYLGLIAIAEENYEEAEKDLLLAARNGNYPNGYYDLGLAQILSGKNKEAIETFERAVKYNPVNLKARGIYSVLLRRYGRYDEALNIIRDGRKMFETESLLDFEKYFCLKEQGRKKQAGDILKVSLDRMKMESSNYSKYLKDRLVSVHGIFQIALDYLEAGFYDETGKIVKILLREVKEARDYAMIYYLRAYILSRSGKKKAVKSIIARGDNCPLDYVFPNRAIEEKILKAIIKLSPSSAPCYYYLGNILYEFEKKEEALSAWRKAERLGLRYAVLYRNIGMWYWQNIQPVEKNSWADHLCSSLGNIEGDKLLQLEKARTAYKKAAEMPGMEPRIYAEMIRTLSAKKSLKETISIYEKHKMGSGPGYIKMLIRVGRFKKAEEILKKGAFSYSPYSELFIEIGREKLRKKKYTQALKYFEKSLELHDICPPERYSPVRGLYYQGEALSKMGRDKEAMKKWEETFKHYFPSSWRASSATDTWIDRYYQGLSLLMLGRKNEAMVVFDGLRYFTESTFARTNRSRYRYLIYLYGCGKDIAEGVKDELEVDYNVILSEVSGEAIA